ncbi:biotin--[acetyl-CoA-carboxylase] ligase [Flavobacterium humi]|uniref:Biotin--[acetyl-CoA-carboxylase] ligase n=1 Tax=Flavobacterium humi TaxID=2562683 RepID=A0A4Z0L7B0_9FLAO|nr:biotin--[acetyl-CoA-carboxylase] ligase [Flavobacterium humi]TGD58277.1 biotin--[acetyl-CoA-carboxylase] ligase [Flavobacterium humi]
MKVIKLDAIDSTNDFLKGLSQTQNVENFTAVTAKTQTKGKGQMGSKWLSESNKNLITSILIRDTLTSIEDIFILNMTVALAIVEALKKYKIPAVSIKWPNDIMAENKKIAGILIENSIKENGKIDSIVGIGLNVNQTDFENLPKASSLKIYMGLDFDTENLLESIVDEMQTYTTKIKNGETDSLWQEYTQNLFRKDIPTVFEDNKGLKFMGLIQGINPNGKLEVLLEDDSVKQFGIKEITMVY